MLSGAGAENRAALLDHLDAMLDDSNQHDFDEVSTPLIFEGVSL